LQERLAKLYDILSTRHILAFRLAIDCIEAYDSLSFGGAMCARGRELRPT